MTTSAGLPEAAERLRDARLPLHRLALPPARRASESGHGGRCRVLSWPGDPSSRAVEAVIDAAGRRATATAPLAWVRFEADDASPGAALTLDQWSGDGRRSSALGRGDFHGRWIDRREG